MVVKIDQRRGESPDNCYITQLGINPNWKYEPEDEWGVTSGFGNRDTKLIPRVLERKEVPNYAKREQERLETHSDGIYSLEFTPAESKEAANQVLAERRVLEEIALRDEFGNDGFEQMFGVKE